MYYIEFATTRKYQMIHFYNEEFIYEAIECFERIINMRKSVNEFCYKITKLSVDDEGEPIVGLIVSSDRIDVMSEFLGFLYHRYYLYSNKDTYGVSLNFNRTFAPMIYDNIDRLRFGYAISGESVKYIPPTEIEYNHINP